MAVKKRKTTGKKIKKGPAKAAKKSGLKADISNAAIDVLPAAAETVAEKIPVIPHVVEQTVKIEPYPAIVMAAPAQPQSDEYSINRVFRNTWIYFKKSFWINFGAALLPAIAIVPFFVTFFKNFSDSAKVPSLAGAAFGELAVIELVYCLVFWYLMAFITTVYDRRGTGEKWERPGIGSIFLSSLAGFLRLIALMLAYIGAFILFLVPFILLAVLIGQKAEVLIAIIIIIGYLAMLVLMVYAMLAFGPAMVIAVLEPKIIKALKESAAMTKGKRVKILLTHLMAFLVILGFEVAVMVPAGIIAAFAAKAAAEMIAAAGVIFLVLFMALFMPLCYAYYYAIYIEAKTTVK
jgi:hypothetical protein